MKNFVVFFGGASVLLLGGCSSLVNTQPEREINNVSCITEIQPTNPEPIKEPINLQDDNASWNYFRNVYIVQYLHSPNTILWGLKHPISQTFCAYLERGYDLYVDYTQPPRMRFDELELSWLYARSKMPEKIETNLQVLKNWGGGNNYYLLVYIMAWYYCIEGQNVKAKTLLEETRFFELLPQYDISISRDILEALKQKLSK